MVVIAGLGAVSRPYLVTLPGQKVDPMATTPLSSPISQNPLFQRQIDTPPPPLRHRSFHLPHAIPYTGPSRTCKMRIYEVHPLCNSDMYCRVRASRCQRIALDLSCSSRCIYKVDSYEFIFRQLSMVTMISMVLSQWSRFYHSQ